MPVIGGAGPGLRENWRRNAIPGLGGGLGDVCQARVLTPHTALAPARKLPALIDSITCPTVEPRTVIASSMYHASCAGYCWGVGFVNGGLLGIAPQVPVDV